MIEGPVAVVLLRHADRCEQQPGDEDNGGESESRDVGAGAADEKPRNEGRKYAADVAYEIANAHPHADFFRRSARLKHDKQIC